MTDNQTPSSDPPVDELLKNVQSVEQVIWDRMQMISLAYGTLLNVATGREALEALANIMLTARDLERQIRTILDACGCPPELVKDIRRFTDKNLDNIWNNAFHFYNRFLHAQTPSDKVKELTRLYYLLKDVAEVAQATRADRYATGVKGVKEVIQGGW
jgi:hypothetical protein